ncbi:MAG TPA: histidine kinase [Mycobacteriales bacterium]|nr:histidine kinase [Mycobacteriales bacterium]
MRDLLLVAALAIVALAVVFAAQYFLRGSKKLGTPAQRTTYATLHTASISARALRSGLSADSAAKSAAPLRKLLGTPAFVIADSAGPLASEGTDDRHVALVAPLIAQVVDQGRARVIQRSELDCGSMYCELTAGVIVPLQVSGSLVGAIAALGESARPDLLRAAGEVAGFVSSQLELAELDLSKTRAIQAELNFLRAQISPHFVYNALTAIESYIRSDPERARELLVGFADFIRYTFRAHGPYSTLAEELRLVETYLELERARFGERLEVTLRVAPEVLSVALPCLSLQPLVENAVRHGIERSGRNGHVSLIVLDNDTEALITVEDDGVGMDPERLRHQFAGRADEGVGLRNVDERFRRVFGPDFGLQVETGVGLGTRIVLRVPKFKVGVRAS